VNLGLDINLGLESALEFAHLRANRDGVLVSVYKKGNLFFVRPSHHQPPEESIEVSVIFPNHLEET